MNGTYIDGELLRNLRAKSPYSSQQAVADAIGVERKAVLRAEAGKAGMRTLVKLAALYGVNVGVLFLPLPTNFEKSSQNTVQTA